MRKEKREKREGCTWRKAHVACRCHCASKIAATEKKIQWEHEKERVMLFPARHVSESTTTWGSGMRTYEALTRFEKTPLNRIICCKETKAGTQSVSHLVAWMYQPRMQSDGSCPCQRNTPIRMLRPQLRWRSCLLQVSNTHVLLNKNLNIESIIDLPWLSRLPTKAWPSSTVGEHWRWHGMFNV